MNYLDLADRMWPVLNRVAWAHTLLYRTTNGVIGHRIPPFPAPMLLLDHVGAKSGQRRTTPLVYLRDGDDIVIVGSKGGNPRHPAWFHNLRANPDTTIQVGSERRDVRARVATPTERSRLWPKVVRMYREFKTYQERTGREIPLVILKRRGRS